MRDSVTGGESGLRGVMVRGEAMGVDGVLAEAGVAGAGESLLSVAPDAGVLVSAGFSALGRLGSSGIVLSWDVGAMGAVPWRWAESGRGGITGGFDKADAVSTREAELFDAGTDEMAACAGAGGSGVVGGGPDKVASVRGGTEPVGGLPGTAGGVDGAADGVSGVSVGCGVRLSGMKTGPERRGAASTGADGVNRSEAVGERTRPVAVRVGVPGGAIVESAGGGTEPVAGLVAGDSELGGVADVAAGSASVIGCCGDRGVSGIKTGAV